TLKVKEYKNRVLTKLATPLPAYSIASSATSSANSFAPLLRSDFPASFNNEPEPGIFISELTDYINPFILYHCRIL
ncbi:hypothetical protein, partial [Epilithonimonas sp.]|uniref:hypothetical protein n=1 Tax=Epilithonimonas sp. TaxID=2894511 RepID=UPI00289945BF